MPYTAPFGQDLPTVLFDLFCQGLTKEESGVLFGILDIPEFIIGADLFAGKTPF